MKNAFAYRDGTPEGKVFLSRAPENVLAAKKKASDEEEERFAKQSMFPAWIQAVICILLVVGLLVFAIGLGMLTDEEFAVPSAVSIALTSAGGGLIVLLIVCLFLQGVRAKRVKQSGAYVFFRSEREKLINELKSTLAVPSESFKTDVFGCRFRTTRKGKQKRIPYFKKSYLPIDTCCWREGDAFCVFDGDAVYKFPFENLIEIERIQKSVAFYGWNKQERYNQAKYKSYKVRYNSKAECFTVKPCYRVRLWREEEYELIFPSYEGETLTCITGKQLP